MSSTVKPDEVIVDETSQIATEHNKKVFDAKLVENGFEGIVSRAVSQFSIILHTRTLSSEETNEFEGGQTNKAMKS